MNEPMNRLAIIRVAKSHESELVRQGLHDLTNAIQDALIAKYAPVVEALQEYVNADKDDECLNPRKQKAKAALAMVEGK
jgi:hypothetical protein